MHGVQSVCVQENKAVDGDLLTSKGQGQWEHRVFEFIHIRMLCKHCKEDLLVTLMNELPLTWADFYHILPFFSKDPDNNLWLNPRIKLYFNKNKKW